MYDSCVRSVLLYGSESWAMTVENTRRISCTDRQMLRWICGVTLNDRVSTDNLLSCLSISNFEDMLRWNRLRYHGHIHRMDVNTWPKKIVAHEVQGLRPKGRPKRKLSEVIAADMRKLGLCNEDADDRSNWRKAIKPRKTQHDGVIPAR